MVDACPDCGGDGFERCNNPDHGFIIAMGGETSRLGCPGCGHDPDHKTGEKCPTCNGIGAAPDLPKKLDIERARVQETPTKFRKPEGFPSPDVRVAAEPFLRALAVLDDLPHHLTCDDQTSLGSLPLPGVWPTVGDLKKLMAVLNCKLTVNPEYVYGIGYNECREAGGQYRGRMADSSLWGDWVSIKLFGGSAGWGELEYRRPMLKKDI
jgi:hypothetical protein